MSVVQGIEGQGFIIIAALHYGHGCANAVTIAWIYSVADRRRQACSSAYRTGSYHFYEYFAILYIDYLHSPKRYFP